jgi:PAS domain S-box-containing protein
MDEKTVNILLVEDEKGHARLIQRAFESRADQVSLTVASTLQEARARLERSPPDLMIVDLVLPDGKGTHLFPVDNEECRFPIVLMTSFGTEQVAVEAMRDGALDYVVKSDASLRDMPRVAERALRQWEQVTKRKRAEEITRLQRDLSIALNDVTTLDDSLRLCLEAAIKVSGMDGGAIYLIDQASGEVDLAHHQGLPSEFVSSESYCGTDSPNTRLVLAGKPIYTQFDGLDTRMDDFGEGEDLRAVGVVPILHGSEVIACLNVASRTLKEVPAACRLALETVAGQMGGAIAKARMQQSLRRSEQWFRSLIELSASVYSVVDTEGKIFYESPSMERWFGWKPEERVGRSMFENVHPDDVGETYRALAKIIETPGGVQTLELRYRHRDGSWRCMSATGVNHLDTPAVGGIVVASHDITEHKRAEKELQESEERFRHLMEYVPGVSIQGYKTDGTVLYWNQASEEVYGYTSEEAIGRNLADLIIPEEMKPLFREGLEKGEQATESGQLLPPGEVDLLHKDGCLVPVYSVHSVVCLEGKEPLMFCIDLDLSQRKQAETAVCESEQLLRATLESTADGILVVDEDGKVSHFNSRFAEMWRIPAELLETRDDKKLLEFVLDQLDDREAFLTKVRDLYGSRDEDLETIRFRDGRVFERYSSPLTRNGDLSGRVWSFRDITERKRAEETTRLQRDLSIALNNVTALDDSLRLCLEAAIKVSGMDGGGIYLIDEDSGDIDLACHMGLSVEFCNAVSHYDADSAIARLIMVAEPNYMLHRQLDAPAVDVKKREGLRAFAMIPICHRSQVIACLNVSSRRWDDVPAACRSVLETISAQMGSTIARLRAEEALQRAHDELEERVERRTAQLVQANEELNREIEERKQAEQATRQSEEQFFKVFHASPIGIGISTFEKGRILDVNDSILRIFGYTRDELVGRTVFELRLWEDSGKRTEMVRMLKESAGPIHGLDMRIRTKSGEIRRCESSVERIELQGQTCNVIMINDVTERERVAESLRRAERLGAVGTLAAGIAHEINNPVGAALLAAETALAIKDDPDNAESFEKCLNNVVTSLDRCGRIVRNLLTFSRDGTAEKQPCEISEVIRQSRDLAKPYAERHRTTIRLTLDRDLPEVAVGRLDMELALINLLHNAIRAGGEDGQVMIRAEAADSGVRISVEDNGCGMTAEQKEHVFEPFYTTWQTQGGTGLGLSITYGIVQDHGGTIEVDSTPGEGTTVTVTLPAYENLA